ncbi:MAG: hypothetical protein FWH19_01225 [Treponema sp.]|nr:hypothetical protein [Treponema sp.]
MNTKKKALMVLLMVAVATGGVFAQTWYESYAPGVQDNKFFLNVGIGFGPTGGYDMGIPPVSASVDFKLPIDMPITLGAFVTYTTWSYSSGIPSMYSIDVTYTNIGFGGRGMYHFNFVENLDAYAGLSIGYVLQSTKVETSGALGGIGGASYDGVPFLLWGLNFGARYFFTDLLGAYFEIGYSGLQYASVGLSLKF